MLSAAILYEMLEGAKGKLTYARKKEAMQEKAKNNGWQSRHGMIKPANKYRRRLVASAGDWRWGICLTYRRWLNFQMHKVGLDMSTPFAFQDTMNKRLKWVLSAETIVSMLMETGEKDAKNAAIIHEGITNRLKRGEPMRRILELLGAWLIETGALMRDDKTLMRRIVK